MIIDITGTVLTPSKNGKDCLGNGQHYDSQDRKIACCCDECDYMLCCWNTPAPKQCATCTDTNCPQNTGEAQHHHEVTSLAESKHS